MPVFFDILQVPSFAIGTDNLWIVRWKNNTKKFNLALGLFLILAIAIGLVLLGLLVKSFGDRRR